MTAGALTDPARLLAAWDDAAAVPEPARSAVLAVHVGAAPDLEAALDLPVGRLAAGAAAAYLETFAETADAVLTCPGCATALDVAVPVPPLAVPPSGTEREVRTGDGVTYRVRPPTTRDLLAVRDDPDPAAALLARCVTPPPPAPAGPADPADPARPGLHTALDAAADELAGSAATVLRTTCPDCGTDVVAPLDVAALLWERISEAAPAALAEIAELAAAFGWSEPEVLALRPARRRAYLALARGRQG